jgi:hypothetical protein
MKPAKAAGKEPVSLPNTSLENKVSADHNQLDDLSGDQMLSLMTTDVMAVKELPSDQGQIDKLRSAIDVKLYWDFVTTRLSDEERNLLRKGVDFSSMRGEWDCYLFEVAQQYGARLLLSSLVMQRVWSWQCDEKDGAHKLKTLFHEIHRSKLIAHGRASGRITTRHRATKPAFVKELAVLQVQLRQAFPKTADAVRQLIRDTIDASPRLFRQLKTNRESLLLLLDDERALAFRGFDFNRTKGDLTPTMLHLLWVSTSENRSPETVRQDLTKVR